MTKHRMRNLRHVRDINPEFATYAFDCSCGMNGDETVAADKHDATRRARRICDEHGSLASRLYFRSSRP